MGDPHDSVRQAELIMALSLATDLGTGQPLERALRTCFLACRMGQHLGLDSTTLRTVYYVALLRFVGCTADARHLMEIFGDELRAQAQVATVELLPIPMLLTMIRYAGQDAPLSERIQKLTHGLSSGIARTREAEVAHCEVSQNIASRCFMDSDIQYALGQIFERWDGRGTPGALSGEQLTPAIRLIHVAQDAEVFLRLGGTDLALTNLRKRAGKSYDPALITIFSTHVHDLAAELNAGDMWNRVLDLEPTPHKHFTALELEAALRAIADFADLRSPLTHNHSAAVAALVSTAASHTGLDSPSAHLLRLAAYVHDLGRLAIPLSIWEKSTPLTAAEMERIRLYPYYTESILSASSQLAPIGKLAALHQERLDGSGYHRGIPAPLLKLDACLLAAADVYQSKREPRVYRTPLSQDAAVAELQQQVKQGKLDSQAVTAIIESVTGRRPTAPQANIANLTERELEVLRLLAAGQTTRQIAQTLVISPKTADHHIQHIYNKIGVSTRAAATLFALQHNLLKDIPSIE